MNSAVMVEVDADRETGFDADVDVDVIDEIRLRTWARKNYASEETRDEEWHPVILDEMTRIDRGA